MYDEQLARAILKKLEEAFPKKLQFDEVRAMLPEFSETPEQEWLSAADSLIKLHQAKGMVLRTGIGDVPGMVANLEITDIGRHKLHEPGEAGAGLSAERDVLLPILTRRQFDEDLAAYLSRADVSAPVCLVLFDIDEFKAVNDTCGHLAGDEVLVCTAIVIKDVCEGKGRCYRWGGDEIAVLLPNYNSNEAVALAERVRESAARQGFERYPNKITLSVGIASYPGTCQSKEELFTQADGALYSAKQGGRDQFCIAPDSSRSAGLAPTMRLSPNQIKAKADGVRLWIKLVNGRSDNFALSVENKSDVDVVIQDVRLESGGCEITEPALAPSPDSWRIPAGRNVPVAWACKTDPAATLIRMNNQKGIFFKTNLRVSVACSILGQSRQIDQNIPVQVNVSSRDIVSLL